MSCCCTFAEFGMIKLLCLIVLTTNFVNNIEIISRKEERRFDILIKGVSRMGTEWMPSGIAVQSRSVDSLKVYSSQVIEALNPFKKSIQQLKKLTQKLHAEHQFKDFSEEGRQYYPDRSNKSEPVELLIKFSLVNRVNFNTSFMQIPTDFFNQRTDLLNEIEWSEALDEHFKQSRKEFPKLTWQYVGFVTGASRNYPGSHLQET